MADQTALAGLRVIDFSNTRTGAQASQTLADFGADVVHVETPGGSPLRGETAWPLWGRGKRGVQLDLHDAADLAVAQDLARGSDVVIETFRPGVAERLGIGYEQLSRDNPGLIHCSITGFGRTGPLANLQGYEGVVAAKLGVMWSLADLTTARPGPSFCTAAYASYPTSQLAIQGILAALYERDQSGVGQKVDTSLVEGLTVHDTLQWFTRVVTTRFSDAFTAAPRASGGVPTRGGMSFRLLIALTKDGKWLQFSQMAPRLFNAMMIMFGFPDWETHPVFSDPERHVEAWELMLSTVHAKTSAEWMAEFTRDPNVWGEQFRKDSELLDHPQMLWNKMVHERDDRDLGKIRMPGPVVRMDATPARVDRPAPRLGEHDTAVRAEAQAPKPARGAGAAAPASSPKPPLDGVTVVELGTYYAGPYGATLLAELGARVIKLEQLDGDPQRNMSGFPEICGLKCLQGKECVAVDLGSERGREIALRIIGKADMVLQAFRAGAAKRLGLDAESLKAINPNLIYQASPGYGEDGPYGHRPAFAPTIGAAAGLAWRQAGALIPQGADLEMDVIRPSATRLGTAVMGVGNSDGISSVTVATGLMLGLIARNRGAGGQHQLTTMLSSVAHALSEVMVEYENRPEPMTAGLDLYGFNALYRLYETTADEWVFLAAPSDREWSRLTAALPDGKRLAADPRFATAEARETNDAALAEELAKIFRTRPGAAWESELRAADVACVVAARGPVEANYMDEGGVGRQCDMVMDSHHPMLDDIPRLKPLVQFSRSTTVAGEAGLVGQHTAVVLRDFGYGDDEIAGLVGDGIIGLG